MFKEVTWTDLLWIPWNSQFKTFGFLEFCPYGKKEKILSKIDGRALHSLYPALLTSYITTTNGSPFCPGHKFPGIPFLWLSLPTAGQIQEINIFIWSWHNVQPRLKLGYSGQSYFIRQAGTDCDSTGTDVTCSQLRAQGQHNRLFLMLNVFWFVMVKVRSGWLYLPRLRNMQVFQLPITTWEFRICRGQALICPEWLPKAGLNHDPYPQAVVSIFLS